MESLYFMNNMGTFIIVIILRALLVPIWMLFQPCEHKSRLIKKGRRRVAREMFWNGWISILTESYLIATLCMGITLKYSLEFNSLGSVIHSTACLATMTLYFLVHMLTFYTTFTKFKSIKRKDLKSKFGKIYDGLDTRKGKKVLL